MKSNRGQSSQPRTRVILLGASNLSSAISTIIRLIQRQLPTPIEFYLAAGFGRSYGQNSRLLARTLPGILESELWRALRHAQQQNPLPTFALITDVGNDLGYNVSPLQLQHWLAETIQRLRNLDARIVITGLPLNSVNQLSNTHYKLARRILFPTNRTTLDEMKSQMATVNTALHELGARHRIPVIDTAAHQYGLDPIHLKKKQWQSHWQKVFQHWHHQPHHQSIVPPSLKPAPLLWLYLWTRWPKFRTILHTPHHRQQPAGTLPDHSTISVY